MPHILPPDVKLYTQAQQIFLLLNIFLNFPLSFPTSGKMLQLPFFKDESHDLHIYHQFLCGLPNQDCSQSNLITASQQSTSQYDVTRTITLFIATSLYWV